MSKAEAIAFREDHDRHQDQELAADKRHEWVEQLVKEHLECEYNPFLPNHVTEALSELNYADAMLIGGYLQASFNLPDNDSAKINLADFVVDRVHDYWHKIAVFKAHEKYDKLAL